MPERSSNGKRSKAPATLDLMGDGTADTPPTEARRFAPKAAPAPLMQEDEHGALFGGEDVDLTARHPADVPVGHFPAPSQIAERDDAPETAPDPFAEDDPFADTPMARMLAAEPPPLSAGMRDARETLASAETPAPVVETSVEPVAAVEDVTPEPLIEQKVEQKEEPPMAAAPAPPKASAAKPPAAKSAAPGLTITRRYTQPGQSVWDTCEWELRTASIVGSDGAVVFEQRGVEIPKDWSQLATNVVVSKYFRGHVGTLEREYSVKQLIGRVSDRILEWGREGSYFATDEDAEAYHDELRYILLHQMAAFNSPVWFNLGWQGRRQAVSACYINEVNDTMESILDLYKTEGMLFKDGSGSGVNLSTLRSSREKLAAGGKSSGPISFMKGLDASAGSIKSGGSTRRAACMRVLDIDHPDVKDFIDCKKDAEEKAHALIDAGYSGAFNVAGGAYDTVPFQNANHSVRVTDEFMQAVESDGPWQTKFRLTDKPADTYKARDLMHGIAEGTWVCGDPGMQYDTTINDWHTCSNTDRIYASNPCCFVGETSIETAEGQMPFESLYARHEAGEALPLVFSYDREGQTPTLREIRKVWVAGHTRNLVEVKTGSGLTFLCTPEHRFLTQGGEYVEAQRLAPGTPLCSLRCSAKDLPEDRETLTATLAEAADVLASVTPVTLDALVPVYDMEVEGTHNFAITDATTAGSQAIVVSNSEYMFLNSTACNLSSLNLMKFRTEDGAFEAESFEHAVRIMITGQEIVVGFAAYPTEKIEERSHVYRTLGLGYANLGALLMAAGLPYDSDAGRAYAGAVTALMTGRAYHQSAVIARDCGGPFAGFAENRDPMLRVMHKHREHIDNINARLIPESLLTAARDAWDETVLLGEQHGYRNAQSTVLAPTGTIGFLMDCDTTGIEPDIAIVKYKSLVGGGMMKIVNQTVPESLTKLGYTQGQSEAIIKFIDENDTIEGAPDLKPEHLPVFDCAFRPMNGTRSIHHMGHIQMMAAAQPFISGAISKCVTGETLLATAQGLVRIGSLYQGEKPNTFRPAQVPLASLGGTRATDAFYYGGARPTIGVTLRSGHRVTGTPNHRLLVARPGRLDWARLDEIEPGDYVATQYGTDLWADESPRLPVPTAAFYGGEKRVALPEKMTTELAWLLGAYAAEGHTIRTNWTIVITNSVEAVLTRAVNAWRSEFGVEAVIERQPGKCPGVKVSSKRIVLLLEALGCGRRASAKRIPDVILRSPKEMVLSFLSGLFLDGYAVPEGTLARAAICLDSPALLDDLQAILTNLGLVHSRISKKNKRNGKTYDEVYLTGAWAQQFARLVPFMEPDKAASAARLLARSFAQSTADVVPGITPAELLALIPLGRSGRNGKGTSRLAFNFLADPRTRRVSRRTLERAAALPGVVLPDWLQAVLRDNLRFSPVTAVKETGVQTVYDVSVPVTHAFVGNGIVNHNTVNVPNEATAETISDTYIQAWKLGLKAVAIYRDGSKRTQPLNTSKETPAGEKVPAQVEGIPPQAVRHRLPDERASVTHKFSIGGHEGYLTVGLYPENGQPGEIFIRMSKEGSSISGLMDSFATAISLALQYGVPLSTLVDKFIHSRFEPSGFTGNKDIPMAKSVMDYIFRYLALRFLQREERHNVGLLADQEPDRSVEPAPLPTPKLLPAAPTHDSKNGTLSNGNGTHKGDGADNSHLANTATASITDHEREIYRMQSDAPPCPECGAITIRSGACYKCLSCGTSLGCS